MAKDTDPQEVIPLEPPRKQDRITLIVSIHHEHYQDQPITVSLRDSTLLKHSEQTWQRRVTIGEDWTPLDMGWLSQKNAGLLCLENLEGRSPLRLPSEEEQAEIAARIVEVAIGESHPWLLPPGMPLIGLPSLYEQVQLRCQKGSAKVKITLFPS